MAMLIWGLALVWVPLRAETDPQWLAGQEAALAASLTEGELFEVNQLLMTSGTVAQIAAFPAMVKAGFQQSVQQSETLSQGQMMAILDAADQSLSAGKVLTSVRDQVARQLSPAEVRQLAAWYQSETGRRVMLNGQDVNSPEIMQQVLRDASNLLADKSRLALAERLDTLQQSTELAMDVQELAGRAIFSATRRAMFPDRPVDMESFQLYFLLNEPELRRNTRQMVLVTTLYAMKNLDVEDIEALEDFAGSTAARKFAEAQRTGFKTGVEEILNDWATDIAKVLLGDRQPVQG
ncbi:MAG: DUF2059 domain-containing protein [Pseudomonadales bacterium]|nr:DUF2059 domain-containing protein [Pseudomonadales bacterium]